MSLSVDSHESTVPECASIRERRPFPAAGFGEQSSMIAYFLTVSLDTPSRLAISRHDTPWASRILIRCCIDTGFVIPFLSRVALCGPGVFRLGKIAGLWRTGALHLAVSVKRTNSYRFFGLNGYAVSA